MINCKQTITSDIMVPNSCWELTIDVNGYTSSTSTELATQAYAGRKFELIQIVSAQNTLKESAKMQVKLLEDGYICWFNMDDIKNKAISINSWSPQFFSKKQIKQKLPHILRWIEKASKIKNSYLWGGTIGPDFDCSGLIQTAFASQEIWIPRDAYQQEKFCKPINFNLNNLNEILPGDLLFFGDNKKCTHVGIYKEKKLYWHSSGEKNGRNGIGLDELQPANKNRISTFYSSRLRSIGRVESCHDGTKLP